MASPFHPPKILALDFDGVICDGLREYFQSSRRTYEQIWGRNPQQSLDDLAQPFYQLRPVIETGWEMPILLRALVLGISPEKILQDWPNNAQQIIELEGLNPQEVSQKLDGVRDDWIESNWEGWLELHRFYPGVIQRLSQLLESPTQPYIITTKAGRFTKKLLEQAGLDFPEKFIVGKEVRRPKYETLQKLLASHGEISDNLWFVEDLLKTLKKVQQIPNLKGIKLYLATWGYNTERDRKSADHDINLLSLEQFTQDFAVWRSYH